MDLFETVDYFRARGHMESFSSHPPGDDNRKKGYGRVKRTSGFDALRQQEARPVYQSLDQMLAENTEPSSTLVTFESELTELASRKLQEAIENAHKRCGEIRNFFDSNPTGVSRSPDSRKCVSSSLGTLSELSRAQKYLQKGELTSEGLLQHCRGLTDQEEELSKTFKEVQENLKARSELTSAINTADINLGKVIRDPDLAVNLDVSNYRKTLESARWCLQRKETTKHLREKLEVLEVDNAHVDGCIEDRTQKEVENYSEQVTDVQCFQPRSGMFRNFEISEVLDPPAFQRLVDDFHNGLSPEKSPVDVYRPLYTLQREPRAITTFNNMYEGRYEETVGTALNERFGGPGDQARLEYALQLIKEGNVDAEQAIKQEEFNAKEFNAAAQRIHQALHPDSGDPRIEVVYAALTPFERNTGLLSTLDIYYNSYPGTGLKSDIENTLKNDPEAKGYALFLLGGRDLEKKKMTLSEVVRLQKALSEQTFRRDDGVHIPVSYELISGHIHWSHIMCEELKEAGYGSTKIFALSLRTDENGQNLANLHVKTDLAPDMPDGAHEIRNEVR